MASDLIALAVTSAHSFPAPATALGPQPTGAVTRNPNEIGVRLWTDSSLDQNREVAWTVHPRCTQPLMRSRSQLGQPTTSRRSTHEGRCEGGRQLLVFIHGRGRRFVAHAKACRPAECCTRGITDALAIGFFLAKWNGEE